MSLYSLRHLRSLQHQQRRNPHNRSSLNQRNPHSRFSPSNQSSQLNPHSQRSRLNPSSLLSHTQVLHNRSLLFRHNLAKLKRSQCNLALRLSLHSQRSQCSLALRLNHRRHLSHSNLALDTYHLNQHQFLVQV